MAIDPNDPLSPYAAPLAPVAWGEPWAWLPPPDGFVPSMPVDTVLVPPAGSNDRVPPPAPVPPPEVPAPAPQQAGLAPTPPAVIGEVAGPAVDAVSPMPWSVEAGPGAGILPTDTAPAPTFDPNNLQFAIDQDVNRAASDADPFLEAMRQKEEGRIAEDADVMARANQYAALAPDEFEMVKAKHQLAADNIAATKLLDASKLDLERAQEIDRVHRAAVERANQEQQAVIAEAKAIAATKEDRGRWWKNASTGQILAGIIGAIAGSIYQTRNGGPNVALQALERAVEGDVESQRADLANRRGALAERRAGVSGMYQSADDQARRETAWRLGAWERIHGQILAEAQNYNPVGTRALKLVETARAVQAKQNEILATFYDDTMKRHKAGADLAGALLDNEGKKLDIAIKGKKLRGSGAGGTVVGAPLAAALKQQYGIDVDPNTLRKDVDWLLGTSKKLKDINAPEAGQLTPKDLRELEIPGIKTKAGGALLARSGPEAREVRDALAGTRRVVQLASKMREIVRKAGGITAAFQTAEGRQLQAATASLYNELRTSNKMGTLDAGALKMVEMMAGGGDTAGWRSFLPTIGVGDDAEAGFTAVAENQVAKMNELLLAQDENAAPMKVTDFADFSSAKRTPNDQNLIDAQKSASGTLDLLTSHGTEWVPEAEAAAAAADAGDGVGSGFRPDAAESRAQAPDTRKIVPPSVRKTIEGFAAEARGGETTEDREGAITALRSLVKDGGNAGIRALARSALLGVTVGGYEDAEPPKTSTTNVQIGTP